MDHGGSPREARRGDDDAAELRDRRAGVDLHVHVQLRPVVGPAQVGGAERDLPRGDQVGGAGHYAVSRAHPLLHADAGVHLDALRHEVCHISLLLRMGAGHDGFHRGVLAGDQRRAAGDHAVGVGKALVLEEVRRLASLDARQEAGSGEPYVTRTDHITTLGSEEVELLISWYAI